MQQIENIFISRQCIKILRYLSLYPNWDFSLTELSKDLGIDKSQIYRIIKKLQERKIVNEIKKGKFSIFRLNRENFFVKELVVDMFKREKNLEQDLFNKIVYYLKPEQRKSITSIIIYGSILTPNFTFSSDIDLMIILSGTEEEHKIKKDCDLLKSEFLSRDLVIFIDVIKKSEFVKLYNSKEPFILNLMKNNKVIYGKELADVIR